MGCQLSLFLHFAEFRERRCCIPDRIQPEVHFASVGMPAYIPGGSGQRREAELLPPPAEEPLPEFCCSPIESLPVRIARIGNMH
jgi:hypothetical protein